MFNKIEKYMGIIEPIIVYSFLGASLGLTTQYIQQHSPFALITKYNNQHSPIFLFLLLFSNMTALSVTNRHYKENKIYIFKKIEISVALTTFSMVIALLVVILEL